MSRGIYVFVSLNLLGILPPVIRK